VTNPVVPPPPPPVGDGAYPAPGAYPPPGSVPPPPATEGLGEAPKKSSGFGKKALSILGVVVVGLVVLGLKFGVASFFAEKDKVEGAKAGTCLTENADPKKMEIVDCAAATAAHKVVAKVPNITDAQFKADKDFSTCKAYDTAENSLWSGTKGSDGYVLCLQPVKK
jgi:hypothetical protein